MSVAVAERVVDKTAFGADPAVIRHFADLISGARPMAVNGVRVAESIRPRKFVIADGDDTRATTPRTMFQGGCPDRSVSNAILRREPNIRLPVTHDGALFASMVAEGVVGAELQ